MQITIAEKIRVMLKMEATPKVHTGFFFSRRTEDGKPIQLTENYVTGCNNGVPVSPCVPIRPCVVNMVFSEDGEPLTVDLRGFLRSSLASALTRP